MPVSRRVQGRPGEPFPHPISQRTFAVTARPPPRALLPPPPASPPVRPVARRVRRVTPEQSAAVARGVARAVAFYTLTAALIVAGVAAHEYAHYTAHEGLGVPRMTYSPSVADAQEEILSVERARTPQGEVLIRQPEETTIVIFPNTLLQAAGLGLIPPDAYSDDGVLASTYFHLDHHEAADVRSRGGAMPADVVAAPLYLAGGIFLVALAWTLWRPSLPGKALLVAYAVQLGDAGHHAEALGMSPDLFYLLSTIAIVVAGILVALRTIAKPKQGPIAPDFRPAKRVVLEAPKVSVRPETDNPITRQAAKASRRPVTWT